MEEAERIDDSTIPDVEDLYRRVVTGEYGWIVTEQTTGRRRVSSQAFTDPHNEISVDLSSMISPEECLRLGLRLQAKAVGGVVAVTAGQARELNQTVVRNPILP